MVSSEYPCCGEHRCTRKQPILVRSGGFDPDRWYAIIRYKRHQRDGKPDMIEAQQKHVLDEDTCAVLNRWRDAYEARPDAATLRERLEPAIGWHIRHWPVDDDALDPLVDAVMAVLADAGLVERDYEGVQE